MATKRPYMSMQPDEGSPPDQARKRLKNLKLNCPHGSALASESRRPFSGPISIPTDADLEMTDIEMTNESGPPEPFPAKKPVINHPIFGTQSSTLRGSKPMPKLYGGLDAFQKTYAAGKQKQKVRERSNRNSPTSVHPFKSAMKAGAIRVPHAALKTSNLGRTGDINEHSSTRNSPAGAVLPTVMDRLSNLTHVISSTLKKAPKMPYVRKTNEVHHPRFVPESICGKSFSEPAALNARNLWEQNQAQSPLLNLPVDIRHRIWEYALGGRTIAIGYKTFHTFIQNQVKGGNKIQSVPVFKYHSRTWHGLVDPYADARDEAGEHHETKGLTLVNGVCRQLYLETAVLPFQFNTFAFDSNLILWNFVMREHLIRDSQSKAIKEIIVVYEHPPKNLLAFMESLEYVTVSMNSFGVWLKGRYRVQRDEGHLALVPTTTGTFRGG